MTLPRMGDWPRSVGGRLTGPVGLPLRKPVNDARGPPHSGTDVGRVFFGLTERGGGALYFPAGPAGLPSDVAVSPISAFRAANCPSTWRHLGGVRSRLQVARRALEDSDGPDEELAIVLRAPLRASAGVDVNRTMLIAAGDVAFGRRAPLQERSRERPQSVPKRTYASRDSSEATLAVTLPQQEVGQLRVPMLRHEPFDVVAPARLARDHEDRPANVGQDRRAAAGHDEPSPMG